MHVFWGINFWLARVLAIDDKNVTVQYMIDYVRLKDVEGRIQVKNTALLLLQGKGTAG